MDNIDNIENYITPPESRNQLGLEPAELQHTLKLAGLLQTSLEITSVLNYFLEAAQQVVQFDAAHYKLDELEVDFKFGNTQRHRTSYRLRLAGEFLGELIFTRRRRFTELEMEQFENLIGQLIYPIRNAIWYQRAILLSKIDTLTGAKNRAALNDAFNREIDFSFRHKTALSLLIFDLDHFKQINDSYGHTTGDDVLRECVKCAQHTIRSTDLLFRFGGEEFVVLLPGVNITGAEQAAERLRSIIEKHLFKSQNGQIPVTISLGAASLHTKDNAEMLLDRADKALYRAKEAGRNQVASSGESDDAATINASIA